MISNKASKVAFILFFLFLSTSSGMALNVDTHEFINKYISQNQIGGFSLGYYLHDRLGFENSEKQVFNFLRVEDWFAKGGRYEDKPPWKIPYFRSRNHFHNPLFSWDNAYYTREWSFCDKGHCPVSAIIWALGPQNPDYYSILNLNPGGDWSWPKTREYFFTALTSTAQATRDTNFANTFRGLGQVMHLLADMSVPEHTRNTYHPSGGYEGRVSQRVQRVEDIARQQYAPNDNHFLAGPINSIASFFDTDQYTGNNPEATLSNTAGLSEYSNANFFTPTTIFSPDFPNPSIENTHVEAKQVLGRDGKMDNVYYLYINRQSPELANAKMASESYFASNPMLLGTPENWKYNLDENVYDEYAKVLMPRAIGYSAGLMSYFFRGTIDVQPLPDSSTLHSINVAARNTTANGDDMLGGEVSLVVRFRELQESGSGTVRTLNYAGDNQYRVYTLPYQTDIPESYSKPLAFDLSANPLPLHITDVTLQLVYRGRLGSEDGAVGVGSVALGSIGTEIDISLPAAGVYSKTTPDNVFTGIDLTASARVPGLNLADGLIELEVRYRWATSDPFASVPVDTEPQNAVSRILRVPEKNGVKTLTQATPVSLQFDLPAGQLPWYATDVYLNLIYRRAGDPETKTLAVGYHDISEPTPVDLFSNTDKVCVNGTWYDAGSPGAAAAVDDIGNRNGIADESDIYPHYFTNILGEISSLSDPAPASAIRYDVFEPGPMPPDTLLRLGYILTDYSFTYSFLATWNTMSTDDHWPTGSPASLYPGTAAKNQTDADGSYSYPGMYTIRGNKMWWGTGIIYDNPFYPTNSSCDWGVLQ